MADANANADWAEAQWIAPGVAVLTCRKCSALVMPDFTVAHEEWHERLRRAVEESDFLE